MMSAAVLTSLFVCSDKQTSIKVEEFLNIPLWGRVPSIGYPYVFCDLFICILVSMEGV